MATKTTDPYPPNNLLQPAPKFIDNPPAPTVAGALANSVKQVAQAK
jgi:hypothetical protein